MTVTEGQSGIVNANFAVTLSAPSGQTVSVGYATADGTATAGSDYIATGGDLVFNPGIISRTLTVQVTSDTLDELDETFLANLTDPANATIADGQGVGTITDDDNPPSLSIGDVTVTEGQSGTVPATFTATLSAQSGRTVTVDFATANGTATAPADYQATVGSLSFPPGVTTRTITVLVKGDTLDEADETYSVDLSNPGNGTIADAQALGTITDDDPAPTISIGDATVTEGDAGTANATFTVDLSTASGRPASVDFATASGSATAPADYQTTSGPLNFAVGETTKTVTVLVNGDLLDEIDETFTVNLSNAVGATIADGLGLGTITDNDPLPALSVNDVTVTEGDSGTVAAAFTVSLSVPSGRSVTVGYATANGSAIAPADFIAGTGTLTFAAGQTTQQAVVLVNGDLLDEVTESFFLNLSGPTNATLSDAQAVGTIIDDDGLPSLSVNDVTVTEGQSGTVNANFTVTLSASSGQTVSVGYSTADGTATAGADYNAGGGNLIFSPGVTTRTLTVQVTSDTLDELDETFFANLADPNNAEIADGQGVGTITDDDNPPSVSIGDVTVAEGNTGNANATFTVALSAASGRTVTVDYATANGTAIAPGDYAAVPLSTLTFNPGQTSRTLTVLVNGDALDEVNETYLVDLSNATNSTIADPQAIGTITDDDPFPAVSVSDATVTEGDGATAAATFTVTLNAPSGRVLSVDFATGDGSAIAPADYAAATGTLTFLAGETTKTVNVLAAGDTLDEIDETFTLSLSNAVNVTVADGLGLGTITDNDPLPTLSINDVTVTEGDSGPVVATFTVSMNVPSGRAASVGYATADGTATAPGDYTSASGTLNFAAGQTTRTFNVNVNGDVTDELDETFTVTLSTAVNATILDGQGVGTITDDDGFPSLSINDVTVTETNSSVNAVFNVTLSNASGQTVSVAYATADGTAVAGADYTSTSGTLEFTAGQLTRTITVPVTGDLLDEIDENFTVTLTAPVNASITDGIGLGTIADNDPTPTLTINDTTVAEGDSGTTAATFTITQSSPSGRATSVDYSTLNGSATAPADYTAGSGTLNFAAGETTKQVTVLVNGDLLDESNETYTLNLANAINATIADGQGLGTINDDDPQPSLSIDDVTVTEGDSGSVVANFTVTLSTISGRTVSVDYAAANGTATAPGDYLGTGGTLIFLAGETTKTVTVTVNGDTLDEANESYFVNLSNPSNAAVTDGQGLGTITDDDAMPALVIDDVTVTEGDTGTTNANFTVSLSSPSGQTVTAGFSTANGTAVAPGDYTARTGQTVTFTAGQLTRTITIAVNPDTIDEVNETYFVNLSNPTNATITDSQGVGTIIDDDGLPVLSVNDVTVTEGQSGTVNANFTVSLSAPSGQPVSVGWATADGTATSPADYVGGGGNVVFNAGVTTRPLTVVVNSDTLDELDETFTVTLSDPNNATIADGIGLGTILDDDAPPVLSVNDVTVTEGDSGTVNAVFTVSLAPVSGRAVSVDWATAAGTAGSPADFEAGGGQLAFAAGEATKQVSVTVNSDLLDEVNETFFVNLSSPTNATLGDAQGLGTITDNDPLPTLAVDDVTVNELRLRHGQRELHREPECAERSSRDRELRDCERVRFGRGLRPGDRRAHLRPGPDDKDDPGRRPLRRAGRGQRDVLPEPCRPDERNARRQPGARDDQRQRPDAHAVGERRDGDRGQHRDRPSHLHRHPQRPEWPQRHGRLRDRQRDRRSARRLCSCKRGAHVRGRRDHEDGQRPGQRRCPQRGGDGELLLQSHERDERDAR